MIAPEIIDAMLSAGASADVIAAAVKADHALEAAKAATKRQKNRDRMRVVRAGACTGVHNDAQECTKMHSDAQARTSPSPSSPPFPSPPITPLTPTPSSSPSSQGRAARATRLPSDWKPSEQDVEYARMRGLTAREIELQAEKFRNYWTAKSGQAATKIDWSRTWQNWIIDTAEKLGRAPIGEAAATGPPAGLTEEQLADWKGGWRPGMPSSAELRARTNGRANHQSELLPDGGSVHREAPGGGAQSPPGNH